MLLLWKPSGKATRAPLNLPFALLLPWFLQLSGILLLATRVCCMTDETLNALKYVILNICTLSISRWLWMRQLVKLKRHDCLRLTLDPDRRPGKSSTMATIII
jgi:hypothetical protein